VHGIGRDTLVDGRYRVMHRLGSGGMADVWCAEDEQLGRRVALKVLAGRFAEDPEFRERFWREAPAAASLQHPNVVGIFDRGEWDDTPYIAMELVRGRTLKEIVDEEGPLPPDRAIDIAKQILAAARYAHRHGVVHRDLKPQNVMVDEEGRAKVADFGVARAGASEMTQTGAIIGTVQYLSPEQAQGQPVSPRSDLYAIGVVLYEMLTGRVPFTADSPVTIALKHVSEAPVPPSQINPTVSPALDAVVLRALEKDPARRFQDADSFMVALEDARRMPGRVAREVRLAPAPGEPWVEEAERESRRWWLWLLALLAIAALALGAYLLLAARKVTVPDVVGLPSATAAQRVHDRGLEVRIQNVVDPRVPRDHVAREDPPAGNSVRKGSLVTLTVSAGPGEAPVPRVQGLKRAKAEAALHKAGFGSRVRRAYSNSVPAGRVISSTPRAGTELEKGRTVTITVSRGKQRVAVPQLKGLSRGAAEAALRARGLVPQASDRVTGSAAPGTVIDQGTPAGTQVPKGTTVPFTVAQAPPPPPTAQVPDVTGRKARDARTQLERAGFQVRERRDKATKRSDDGKVLRQSPPGGSSARKGSTVTITVGHFKAPPKPSPTPSPSPSPSPTPTPTP
jgi:serine/threonine-protein kinase